jgi:phytoene synthase
MASELNIFRKGSRTFFLSSLFFPKKVRQDVFDLYSFVRVADDFVDRVPADRDGFYHFRSQWEQAVRDSDFDTSRNDDDPVDLRVIKNMVRVSRKYAFDAEWIESFLDAMQSDLNHKKCRTLDDTHAYVYGSAEVIGLMMARIMRLPKEADKAAMTQGRAMQFINFIRDIDEDNSLGRQYLPQNELKKFKLNDLSRESALNNPEQFKNFIHYQLKRYEDWQSEAYAGYSAIPRRYRVPLQTATDMYDWTAEKIRQEPLSVYRVKHKPSRWRVISTILTNTV